MNQHTALILTILLLDFFLTLISEWLNLRAMSPYLPEDAEGIYNKESYQRSQTYQKTTTRFGLLTKTTGILILLLFWFSEGFNELDQWVRGFGWGPLGTGLVYIGLLVTARQIIMLPFSIYSTFVIEKRFNFNKTTSTTFISDLIKGFFLMAALGGPLLVGIFWLLENVGPWAWTYCWAGTGLYLLVMQYLAPTWIIPLFHRFLPLEEGELRQAIQTYTRKVNFSVNNIFVLDGSKRSSKPNAFFTGFGKNKRIALFDTLIEQHSIAELQAVLAHEIGHYKKKHSIKNMVFSVMHIGLIFFLFSYFLKLEDLYDAFFIEQPSVYSGLILFAFLFSPIELVLSTFFLAFSRKCEYEADRFATLTIDNPEHMVEALKKLTSHNLSNLTPHSFHVFLNDSHPPVMKRIKSIRSTASLT